MSECFKILEIAIASTELASLLGLCGIMNNTFGGGSWEPSGSCSPSPVVFSPAIFKV